MSKKWMLQNRRLAPLFIACVLTLSLAVSPLGADDDLRGQAARAASAGNHEQAIKLLTQIIEKRPDDSGAYYVRGREHFRAGLFAQSVADFNKHVELSPELESRQWERGIAFYYAGKFEDGAKQFALYQTFHNQDVENSTWRYLCMARSVGVEKARAAMLPIENDPRIPMMQIYELYRGKIQPDDVLSAARSGTPSESELAGRLFYAHLYLGLYHEANGNNDLAKKHILESADEKYRRSGRINTYMWDVARVHAAKFK